MASTPTKNLGNGWRNIRCFAAVVRSPVAVRNAFEGQSVLAWWWEGVLALHGRPLSTNGSVQDHCRCIGEGFRFYGWLYRALSLVLGAMSILCWAVEAADLFWVALLLASAIYLWTTSKLAFSGAAEFCSSRGERVWYLVAFLFFITLFLASVVTATSIQARIAGWVPDELNGVITAIAMAFGVGSYFIEVAALVTKEPARSDGSPGWSPTPNQGLD